MKLLVVLSRFPYPTLKGDKLRAFFQLRELAQDHEVHVFCTSYEPVTEADRAAVSFLASVHVERLGFRNKLRNLLRSTFRNEAWQVGYFRSRQLKATIAHRLKTEAFDAVYVQLIRATENVPVIDGPVYVLDYMDALAAGLEKRAQHSSWAFRLLERREARQVKRYERHIAAHFHRGVLITEADRAYFGASFPLPLDVVPNGIEETFFRGPKDNFPPQTRPPSVVFTGNMSYAPNAQAARRLVEQVMPRVWRVVPDVQVYLVGTDPLPEVRALASEGVHVTGWVEDVRPFLAQSWVFCAPMVSGAGLQNKLLEAMAMRVPCVTSEMANRALGAPNGEAVLASDSDEQLAAHVLALLRQPTQRQALAEAGEAFVREHFSWQHATVQLTAVFARAKESAIQR